MNPCAIDTNSGYRVRLRNPRTTFLTSDSPPSLTRWATVTGS